MYASFALKPVRRTVRRYVPGVTLVNRTCAGRDGTGGCTLVKKGRLLTGWSGSSQLHTSALVVVPSVAA